MGLNRPFIAHAVATTSHKGTLTEHKAAITAHMHHFEPTATAYEKIAKIFLLEMVHALYST